MRKFASVFVLVYACLFSWGFLAAGRLTVTGFLGTAVLALIFTLAWWRDVV